MSSLSAGRLLAMARKESIQLVRDPRSLALAFVLPLFMLLFFGYAITWDLRNIKLAVLDRDLSQHSRRLVEAFAASGYFMVTEHLSSDVQVDQRLRAGE